MHKDVIDSYRLKKRKELQLSVPAVEGVDMVSAMCTLYRVHFVNSWQLINKIMVLGNVRRTGGYSRAQGARVDPGTKQSAHR